MEFHIHMYVGTSRYLVSHSVVEFIKFLSKLTAKYVHVCNYDLKIRGIFP
jgi:hypothetical protein